MAQSLLKIAVSMGRAFQPLLTSSFDFFRVAAPVAGRQKEG